MEWWTEADGKRALHLEERKQSEKNKRWGLQRSSCHAFIYVQQLQQGFGIHLATAPTRMQDSQCKHGSNGPFRVFSCCLLIPLGLNFLKSAPREEKLGWLFDSSRSLISYISTSSSSFHHWVRAFDPQYCQFPYNLHLLVCFINLKLYL